MTTALVDTSVLSNFAQVGQPSLLQAAFAEVVTTPSVMAERAEGERLGRLPTVNWAWLPVVELTPEEATRFAELHQSLGAGEASCLAVAQARGWMVLTDDRDARRVAQTRGVAISGTLGALVNLVDQGTLTLDQADSLLTQMKQYGYRCPVVSLRELLGEP